MSCLYTVSWTNALAGPGKTVLGTLAGLMTEPIDPRSLPCGRIGSLAIQLWVCLACDYTWSNSNLGSIDFE